MNSPIKLPPLPYPQMPGNDYTAADMRAYAEQAVREALASTPVAGEAQQPVAHWIPSAKTFSTARVSPGKAWEPLYAAPRASEPPKENNHAEGADQ